MAVYLFVLKLPGLRRIKSRRLLRLLTQFILLFVTTFAIVLPIACNDLRNSVYYNKTFIISTEELQEKLIAENDARLGAANLFLSSLTPVHNYMYTRKITDSSLLGNHAFSSQTKTTNPLKSTENPQILIEVVIASQSRNPIGRKINSYEPNYLTQVAAKWIHLLNKESKIKSNYMYNMSICNVDPDPEAFAEANNLSRYLPVYRRFEEKTKYRPDKASRIERKIKEKEDFIFCIENSLQSHPKYILFLEDDSLPVDEFFVVLRHVLDTHVEGGYLRGERERLGEGNVSWVKLYHPEYFSQFIAYETERVPEWISISVVIATILTYINIHLRLFTTENIHLVWLLFLVYALLLTLSVGRPNLMGVRRYFSPYLYSYVPAPGCCMPGMLFNSDTARDAISYMNRTMTKHRRWAKDQVLDLYVKDSAEAVNRFMVQPNILTHIGMVSSVRASVDPRRVDH